MSASIKVTGTLIVHYLDNLVLRFNVVKGEVFILGETNISDKLHAKAAKIIAEELEVKVIWQDIAGTKHFVDPGEYTPDSITTVDPREEKFPPYLVVCK